MGGGDFDKHMLKGEMFQTIRAEIGLLDYIGNVVNCNLLKVIEQLYSLEVGNSLFMFY